MGPPGCPVHSGHVLFDVRCTGMGDSDFCARRRRIECAAESRWRGDDRCPGVAPDSPVNFSRVAPGIPEGEEFESESPGAPDRYCALSGGTPDSPVCQTRVALGCPFAPLLNPTLGLFIG